MANQFLQSEYFQDSVAVPAIVMSAGLRWYTNKGEVLPGFSPLPGKIPR
jgi:hypothetical protein